MVRPWSPIWVVAAMATSSTRSAGSDGLRRSSSRMHLMTRSSARVSAYWPFALPAERGADAVDEDDLSQLSGRGHVGVSSGDGGGSRGGRVNVTPGARWAVSGGHPGALFALLPQTARPHSADGIVGARGRGSSPRRPSPPPKDGPRVPESPARAHRRRRSRARLPTTPARHLTLVLVLDGFLDAGNAAARAAQHLVDLAGGQRPVVATFDVDAAPRLPRPAPADVVRPRPLRGATTRRGWSSGCCATPAARRSCCSTAPEPDNRWEAFARAVREVVERFGVTRVVSMGSVPMAVPHTRPIAITPHANRPELITGESPWRGELRIPSSAQALLEVRLGEWGHDALGFVAHIPHYLAQLEYPQAADRAARARSRSAAGLTIDLSGLRAEAEDREAEIARYLASNDEVSDVVTALEQQYDAFERAEESGSSLLAEDQPLPTGEEIGQQFEQFLAGLDDPDAEAVDGGAARGRLAAELVELLDARDSSTPTSSAGASPTPTRQRVFGGQVAAQALVAGIRTVDPAYVLHSLHSYFLRPGDTSVPIVYDVERAARRTLLRDPAGRGAPARPADLLPDRQLPARRGGSRAPGRRCPR